ncbi:hypothetical protein ACVOMV_03560 [Mesorhizobium atlanticum]
MKPDRASDLKMIAGLRKRARWYRAQSQDAADALVEKVLETAIAEIENRPSELDLKDWLDSIMRRYLN